MSFLSTFLYYICFASVILMYGIGTNKILDISFSLIKNITYSAKILISILLSILVSWFVTKGILVHIHLAELFPLVAFLIYICINTFLEALLRLTTGKSTAEFIFSYLVIILAISESTSFVNSLIITLCSISSFVLIIPLILAFRKRNNDISRDKLFCRLFLFLAIIILTISVWDIMWINPEVLQ